MPRFCRRCCAAFFVGEVVPRFLSAMLCRVFVAEVVPRFFVVLVLLVRHSCGAVFMLKAKAFLVPAVCPFVMCEIFQGIRY